MRPRGRAEPGRFLQPRFYYDLRDPECWLWAERVNAELPEVPEWVPVALATEPVFRCAEERNSYAPRAATYARHIGRAVAFSLAAFRQAYAAGRDLDDPDTLLIAAAACEIHPNAMTKALESDRIAEALQASTAEAEAVPTVT